MSLKLTRRTGSPFWWFTGTIGGQRIRESAGTGDREVAEVKLRALEFKLEREAIHGTPTPVKSFAEAALSYMDDEARAPAVEKRVIRLVKHFGSGALCTSIDQAALDAAAKIILRPGYATATKLREIVTPARAVLTYAAWRGWCPPPQLRVKVKQVLRTEWLAPHQAEALERKAPDFLRPLLLFLLGTGARMGEAVRLEWQDVDLRHGRVRLRKTKNNTDRDVDIPPRVVAAMAGIQGREGKVFLNSKGKPYPDTRDQEGGGQIREPWARMCARAGLPGEWVEVRRVDRKNASRRFRPLHTPHSARHTWASWHYAEHRDVLRLKADGGWKDVKLVERYTHLTPAGMLPAIKAWRHEPASLGTPVAHDADRVA